MNKVSCLSIRVAARVDVRFNHGHFNCGDKILVSRDKLLKLVLLSQRLLVCSAGHEGIQHLDQL